MLLSACTNGGGTTTAVRNDPSGDGRPGAADLRKVEITKSDAGLTVEWTISENPIGDAATGIQKFGLVIGGPSANARIIAYWTPEGKSGHGEWALRLSTPKASDQDLPARVTTSGHVVRAVIDQSHVDDLADEFLWQGFSEPQYGTRDVLPDKPRRDRIEFARFPS